MVGRIGLNSGACNLEQSEELEALATRLPSLLLLRRRFFAFLILILSISAYSTSFADSVKEAIFRNVRVHGGKSITLGEPFLAADLATAVDARTFELRKGTFSGSKRITVVISDNGLAQSLTFAYETHVTFPQVVSSYRRRLGEPVSVSSQGDDEGFYWSDGSTRFEVLKPSGSRAEVISRLIDLTKQK